MQAVAAAPGEVEASRSVARPHRRRPARQRGARLLARLELDMPAGLRHLVEPHRHAPGTLGRVIASLRGGRSLRRRRETHVAAARRSSVLPARCCAALPHIGGKRHGRNRRFGAAA